MSMIINGKTGLTGLLGSPVGHSKSPMMHNTSFQELGINYVYLCFDVGIEGLSGAVDGLVSLGAKGWNCTMPNKSKMAQDVYKRQIRSCLRILSCLMVHVRNLIRIR